MNDQPTHIKKLAQAASNYSIPAPDRAWDKINKKVKYKNTKKIKTHGIELHTMVLLALIAISAVVVVFYQIDKRKQIPQVQQQYQQTTKPESAG